MHRGRSSSDSCLQLGQVWGNSTDCTMSGAVVAWLSGDGAWDRVEHLISTEVHSSPILLDASTVLSTDTPRADTVDATRRRLHMLGLLRHREQLAGLESLRIGRITVPSVVLLVNDCLAMIGPQAHHCNAPANE